MTSEIDERLYAVAKTALEPFTNKNNPDNNGLCNVCKKENAIKCIDCERLDVSMCSLDHLNHFGTSQGTLEKYLQCNHAVLAMHLGIMRCILVKCHSGKHITNHGRIKCDTRSVGARIIQILNSIIHLRFKK